VFIQPKKTALGLSFPYVFVCPKPVLVKRSHWCINGSKMPFSHTIGATITAASCHHRRVSAAAAAAAAAAGASRFPVAEGFFTLSSFFSLAFAASASVALAAQSGTGATTSIPPSGIW
jgi:hypothetical protein